MKRTYLYIMLLVWSGFYSGTANAQSYVETMLTYKVTVHYPEHTVIAHTEPVEKVSLLNDRLYYWYGGNQISITQGGYSGKLLNGDYQDIYGNKNLKESGIFKEGLKTGIWKNWTDEGVLKDEFTFHKGKRKGTYFRYDQHGKVAEKGNFQDDLLNGKQEIMKSDSTVVVYYKQGKAVQKKSILPKFIYKVFPKKSKK